MNELQLNRGWMRWVSLGAMALCIGFFGTLFLRTWMHSIAVEAARVAANPPEAERKSVNRVPKEMPGHEMGDDQEDPGDGEEESGTGHGEHGTDEEEMSSTDPELEVPEGVFDLENPLCPVMKMQTQKHLYVDLHGVRIHTCCEAFPCARKIEEDPAAHLQMLLTLGGLSEESERVVKETLKELGAEPVAREGTDSGEESATPEETGEAVVRTEILDLENPTCPVMGNPTDAQIFTIFRGLKIRFCCASGCEEAIFARPQTFLQKLLDQGELAPEKEKAVRETLDDLKGRGYEAPTVFDLENPVCPVMGNETTPEVRTIYRNLNVRFCCAGCEEPFHKKPSVFLRKLLDSGDLKPEAEKAVKRILEEEEGR